MDFSQLVRNINKIMLNEKNMAHNILFSTFVNFGALRILFLFLWSYSKSLSAIKISKQN